MNLVLSRDTACHNRSRARAFTLVEMMVAMGLGILVLSVVATLTMYTVRSFVAMGNYNDLERASSHALDTMTKEIRQSARLDSYATNRIQLSMLNSSQKLIYEYNPAARTLTQIKGSQRDVLLEQCDYLQFNISQRNPSNDFSFYPAPANRPDLVKLIDVSWKCSRKILGQKLNTESVQTSKIVIRN